MNFNREVKFPEDINEIRFVFYEKTANIDNMFKGVKSLVSVEVNSKKKIRNHFNEKYF